MVVRPGRSGCADLTGCAGHGASDCAQGVRGLGARESGRGRAPERWARAPEAPAAGGERQAGDRGDARQRGRGGRDAEDAAPVLRPRSWRQLSCTVCRGGALMGAGRQTAPLETAMVPLRRQPRESLGDGGEWHAWVNLRCWLLFEEQLGLLLGSSIWLCPHSDAVLAAHLVLTRKVCGCAGVMLHRVRLAVARPVASCGRWLRCSFGAEFVRNQRRCHFNGGVAWRLDRFGGAG